MTLSPDVEAISLTPTPAVVLERKIRRDRLGEAIDEGIRRVRAAGTAARVPTLRSTLLPRGRAVRVWHAGPFRELAASFSRVAAWVESRGLASGDPLEWYWTSADAQPPGVQIVWPVREA